MGYQFDEFLARVEDGGAGSADLGGAIPIAEAAAGVSGKVAGVSGAVAIVPAAGAETGKRPNRSR